MKDVIQLLMSHASGLFAYFCKVRFYLVIGLLFLPAFSFSQSVKEVKFSFLDSLMKNNNDTTYVINFWATWCKPCVAELPAFEEVNATSGGKKIKVILVSLDFKNQLNSRLIPYVKEKRINSTVVLLDEPNYNAWIDKVDRLMERSYSGYAAH